MSGASDHSLPEGANSRVLPAQYVDITLTRLCRLVADYFSVPSSVIFRADQTRTILVASHGMVLGSEPTISQKAHVPGTSFTILHLRGEQNTYKLCALQLLNNESQPIGWLGATLSPETIGPEAEEVLDRFARVVESTMSPSKPPTEAIEFTYEHCPLTGLLNRTSGLNMLNQALASARLSGTGVALVIADIADFNAINSAFGRRAGDSILRAAARRLASLVPETAHVFRFNGDQFGLILLQNERDKTLEKLISKITTGFMEPVRAEEREVVLCFVFGGAYFPHRANSTPELIDRAILALRRAQECRSGSEVFTTELEERLIRDVSVEQRLRSALGTQSIAVAYQPKVCLKSGKFYSIEALARWIDDELGFVSPGEFIPAAERSGLIVDLGRQVLHMALTDIVRLRTKFPNLTVSVNVAAAQLQRDEFVEEVLEVLLETGAPCEALELEVVETSLIENIERAQAIVKQLRAHGVEFSIDDFGTGYSSLAYLRQLAVQTLKIDREFIGVITAAQRDAALVQSIISMAHVLNFKVVAEGVETEEQAKLLQTFMCDSGQGYLWSKPLPYTELVEKLKFPPSHQ